MTRKSDPRRSRALLAQMAEMMPHCPTIRDVSQRALWLARELAWCDSAALFFLDNDRLEVEVFRSAHRGALLQTNGLGVREPLAIRVLREGQPSRLLPVDLNGHRVFHDEPLALAVPIHNYGVLYLGRREGPEFTEDDVTNLVALCQQTHFALMVARLSGSRSALQAEEAQSRRQAENLLNDVSSIVELMSELLTLTEPLDVLETTGRNLFRVANFEFWTIAAGEMDAGPAPQHFLTGPGRLDGIDKTAVLELVRICYGSGRTLSFVQMERLTLPRPGANIRSVLMCPMLADNKVIGCLMIGCVRPTMSRHERELLSTLAIQVGSHFWNLHLHQELVQTHRSLKASQAQLVQSSKMAAVGQLAAGVAHELNTPLGAMNLAIEGAIRVFEKKPDRAIDRLDRALKSGNQLKEIVSKLLHYSKKTDSVGEAVDLNEVVRDSLSLIGHQLRLENVQVSTALSDVPLVTANKNELQQVVINLLTNAKDAVNSKEGENREIIVSTQAGGDTVRLSVQDYGTGMTRETVDKIFDPFYTTKDVGKGTGLGMSVSKEIVEENGGHIDVETALGEGTTMTLIFPSLTDSLPTDRAV